MPVETVLTLAIVAATTTTLVLTRLPPDGVMLGALTLLILTGIVTPAEGLAGFANEATLTVAAFYVIAAGLRETGALSVLTARMLGGTRRVAQAQFRIMAPVVAMSAFVNNTPVVAAFLPAITDWARKRGLSPSWFLMPLSYAAILGGTCTLVGTSTNLVVNGLLRAHPGQAGMGFFELAWVGVPCALIGIAYVVLASPFLLKARVPAMERLRDPREYTVEMEVELDGPLVGRTVEGAGLRHLPGLFLVEVNRDETVLPVVSPELVLRGGDRLVFAGITDSVLDLQNIRGLRPAAGQTFKLDAPRNERRFFEAVVAAGAPVAERTVRESAFRSHYRAVVIAVAREGRRVQDKIGNIRLAAGDTLLLEADAAWERRYRHSRDFLLVRPIEEIGPLRHEKAWMAWTILALVVVAATLELTPLVAAALLGAGAMVLTRCCTGIVARLSVDLPVIIVIACAFGFGKAMQVSGAGTLVGRAVLAVAGENPLAVLAAVYGATTLLTAVITNNAAAALMFPIAAGVAAESGMNLLPLAVAIAMAASAEFSTPIGYQTNLMVYGPGGYRFTDYLRFGLPLNLLAATATLIVVPRVWPLT